MSINHRKSTKGQALLEVMLLIPFFVIIVSAIAWQSRMFITRIQLLNAARYGTDLIRHLNCDSNTVKDEVEKYLTGPQARNKLDSNKLNVRVVIKMGYPPPIFNPPTSYVEVYYSIRIPGLMGRTVSLSGRSEVLNGSYTTNYGFPNRRNHS